MNQSMDTAIIPAAWGPRGRGAEISFTIVDSPFGRMLVAVTARGICALSVHQSDQWQESELRRDFHEANPEVYRHFVRSTGVPFEGLSAPPPQESESAKPESSRILVQCLRGWLLPFATAGQRAQIL